MSADASTCPLCTDAGPPVPAAVPRVRSHPGEGPSAGDSVQAGEASGSASAPVPGQQEDADADADDDGPSSDLVWIACEKCDKWYHSVCILRGGEGWRETVPSEVLDAMESTQGDEGEWFNWTGWVEKWYCRPCLDWSVDPSNPRPPRHPLHASLKANFAKLVVSAQMRANAKRATSPSKRDSSGAMLPPANKRARLSPSRADSVFSEGSGDAPSRPKRKAAENAPDYHAWNHGIAAPTTKWLKLIADPEEYGKDIHPADYPCLPGKYLSREWLESNPNDAERSGYPADLPPSLFHGPSRKPILVRPADGGFESMGGHIPSKDLKVSDVAELVGRNVQVDVIDVATQQSSTWSLGKWADYFTKASDPAYNGKVYNVISLEITGTALAKRVKPPQIVREIDWVDNCWNFPPGSKAGAKAENGVGLGAVVRGEIKEEGEGATEVNGNANGHGPANGEAPKGKAPNLWPRVQLYCLMGIRGSWTDWHVDFAASSVYYTIHTGSKEFFFIEPTEDNLKAYAQWSGSHELQANTWLGDMVRGGVARVRLEAGDTMIIPSGYIHAVYTPKNAIVFGGNFLHSYNISTRARGRLIRSADKAELRLRQIEIDTKVPQRFRFPFFDKLCWYVAEKNCNLLRQLRKYNPRSSGPPKPISAVVLHGLLELARFLCSQADIVEDSNNDEKRRKMLYDRIPHEVVRDPAALARELEWRVARELGLEKQERAVDGDGSKPTTGGLQVTKTGGTGLESRMTSPLSHTTRYEPTPWEKHDHFEEVSSTTSEKSRPVEQKGGETERKDEKVEAVVRVWKQDRSRRWNGKDGSIVMDEQVVVLTHTRTTWAATEAEQIVVEEWNQ